MSSLFIFISYPRACIFFPARSAIIRNLLLFSKRMASTGPATGHSLRTRGEKKSPLQIITVRDELSCGSTLFELTLHSLYIIHQRLLCQNLLIMTITESPGRIGAAQSWSSITFLLKPLHHKTGFLSVTFAVIYSSLLRFVFCVRCFLAPDSFRLYHPMRGCQDLHGRKIYFPGDFCPAVCRAIFSFAFSGISSRANS